MVTVICQIIDPYLMGQLMSFYHVIVIDYIRFHYGKTRNSGRDEGKEEKGSEKERAW